MTQDNTYNGWTNYATWRVNLEIFDGIDPNEMGWPCNDRFDLADNLKEYVGENIIDLMPNGLGRDWADAFISDVNWREIAEHMLAAYCEEYDPNPFHVVGVDENDGNETVLEQFNNSGAARQWMLAYVAKENAGNWKHIQVLDKRDAECAETLWRWEAA